LSSSLRDTKHLLDSLTKDYAKRFPGSSVAHDRARQVLVDGISHSARLFEPYPFRIESAQGAYVADVDGHRILDFWQGHYANILGHNPAVIRTALVHELEDGFGLQTGLPEERQTEFAESLARATGNERVRLTTAGTLATMYAIMLSRAFTRRSLVAKAAGGWHGANPMALKGVGRGEGGFDRVDSAGMPDTTESEIIVATYNDAEGLRRIFHSLGDRIACLIFEPCLGSAGFIPATQEFMDTARELTHQYGALLILDEIITGFRYCASGLQRLYGIQADLTAFGKVVGGGMPLSGVAGRADVLDLASVQTSERVWFNGGTFSAHPLALLAGKHMIDYLVAHEDTVYPTLAARGDYLREGIERAFAEHGILARCTGHSTHSVAGSSVLSVYFPYREDHVPHSAETMLDPQLCDVELREKALKLGLLLHDVNVMHGLGAISLAHSKADLNKVIDACGAFAERVARGE